ncbi:MAG: branched-chain amino acid ABC transporter permease [Pseudomonadota bacterium]
MRPDEASLRRAGLAGLVALLLVGPWFLGSYHHYLLSLALINVVLAIGLNLLTGNAGQISLCHSSFMAIGAYTSAFLLTQLGLTFWLALPLAGAVSGLFGVVLGLPALRLRGFYLAVVTLGFLEIMQIIIESLPSVTGGVRGLAVPRPSLFGVRLASDLSLYYVILAVAFMALYAAWRLLNSPIGRAFNSIRVSEATAETLAIPVTRVKLIAFVVAAVYAGVAGAMFATLVRFIDPLEFGVWTSIRHVTFIVVGGLGSVAGSVIGAAVLTVLPELLRGFKEYNELVYGGLLLLVLMVMPSGLIGLWPALKRLLARGTAGAASGGPR